MAKKKRDITDAVVDVVTAGTAVGVGGAVLGSVGAAGGPQVQQLTGTAQRGLQLTAAGIPIIGAAGVLGELEKVGLGKKRKG